jgi:hypothetical protein
VAAVPGIAVDLEAAAAQAAIATMVGLAALFPVMGQVDLAAVAAAVLVIAGLRAAAAAG